MIKLDTFRSREEFYYAHWLEELKQEKLIKDWEYEPMVFNLIPSYGEVGLRATTYTPDFYIEWYPKAKKYFEKLPSWIDVKGKFQRQQNDFPIKQKLMYMIHGLYVQKYVLPDLFEETFAPEEYFYTPKKRQKRKLNMKNIKEWLH